MNHQLLLSRLREFGLDTATCGWFSSYLADKCQTCINAVQSEEVAVDTGAPQGSVLGPLLFSLFVNNLPAQLKGVTIVLFADDTSLYIAGRSTDDMSNTLTCALGSAHKWLLDSGLKLNVGKTRCMLISSNRRKSLSPLNVQLDGVCIEQVCTHKFLGVMVNQSLSWSNHIDLVSSRASKGLSLLRSIAWFLPKHVLLGLSEAI